MNKKRQLQYHRIYMNLADEISSLSQAERNKVGCLIVKDNSIVSFGFNGMPSGFENTCEVLDKKTNKLITKTEVLHAESNALAKLAKTTFSSLDADLYVTLSPCIECAKLIKQSGIKRVFYKEVYRNIDGLDFLKRAKIKTILLK